MAFLNALTLVFLVLKLIGVIHWPWIAVVIPSLLYGGTFVVLSILKATGKLD